MITACLLWVCLGDGASAPAAAGRGTEIHEARRALEAAPPSAFGLRVEAARALIEAGDDRRATDELDRILRHAPDERHVLALLASRPPRIALEAPPAEGESVRAAWLRAGAREFALGGSPVRRELVVRELARAGRETSVPAQTGDTTLFSDLIRTLEDGVTTRRAFAAFALRRLYAGSHLGPLAARAVFDPAIDVRDEAVLALRAARDPAACGAVVVALSSRNASVRARAAEALGRMGYREAVEPLVQMMLAAAPAPAGASGGGPVRANLYVGLSTAYVKDYDLEIAQGASVANPIVDLVTSGVVFDVGVGGTSSLPITTEVWSAAGALTRLTGERFGADAGRWRTWWAAHRDEYLPRADRAPSTGD